MIGFLAEVQICGATRATRQEHGTQCHGRHRRRARGNPAGLGSAPTPLGHPGRLTAAQLELPTCRPSQCPRAPVPAISIHDTRPRLHMLLVPSRKYMLALSTEQSTTNMHVEPRPSSRHVAQHCGHETGKRIWSRALIRCGPMIASTELTHFHTTFGRAAPAAY
jgi:hypothetical protein